MGTLGSPQNIYAYTILSYLHLPTEGNDGALMVTTWRSFTALATEVVLFDIQRTYRALTNTENRCQSFGTPLPHMEIYRRAIRWPPKKFIHRTNKEIKNSRGIITYILKSIRIYSIRDVITVTDKNQIHWKWLFVEVEVGR